VGITINEELYADSESVDEMRKSCSQIVVNKKSLEKWSFQAMFKPLGGKQILKCFRSFSESKNANLQEMLNISFT
jgi:hypothetical protein